MNQISRLLIANRGEVACRIAATCHQLGMEVAVVHTEADATARHVRVGDTGVAISASRPAAAYLDRDAIVRGALDHDCDAVHPGYGFLAEDPDFAAAVEAAGLLFVGPRPGTMRLMADKLQARHAASAAGLDVLPGTDDYVTSPTGAENAAAHIGYPVLVKAVQGGGGIGMASAGDADELREAYPRVTSMAERFFGDGRVILEQHATPARHVEVQVLGDGGGRAIHLHDRDCTIQRRHQKVIEEAPAFDIPDGVRRTMQEQSVALAESLKYRGVGTVELLFTDGKCYFLEMNTRLQVEHPVTEMTTGLDLVEAQLRVAEGRGLPISEPPAISGHAVECRVYAEDPSTFRPSPGVLATLRLPTSDGVRIDSGYDEGDEVTPFFDPLMLKVITHAGDRSAAVAAMERALSALAVDGVATNVPALLRVLRSDAFRAKAHDLTFMERLTAERAEQTNAGKRVKGHG